MKIILKEGTSFVIRFDRGDEVKEGLTHIAKTERIDAGSFSGIGAVSEVILNWYDPTIKAYSDRTVSEELELTSFNGNISTSKGAITVHAHGTFANSKFEAIGGHVKRMVISATCEVVLQKLNGKIERRYSEETGLNLMD